jgi:hypothetical protein
MRHRAGLATVAALLSLAVAMAGCAASSNTTSASAGATRPPTATSPPATNTTVGNTTTGSATTPQGGPSALSVTPAVGSKQSVMRFSFASPADGAAQSSMQTSSALSIVGPRASGCVGVHDEPVPSEPGGQTVNVAVGPAQLGGPWCAGTYTARVEVVQRPKCSEGQMCPQFIRVLAVLGPVTFRISG